MVVASPEDRIPKVRLNPTTVLRRELYTAMRRAGIDRVGPTGEKRTFHSFRHTFAKIALEERLGDHLVATSTRAQSLNVTNGVYGHWEREARKAQMAELAGFFNVHECVRASVRVPACLRRVRFVTACCSRESALLQALSVRRSLSQLAGADF